MEDRRILKSKNAIKEAFVELLTYQDYNEISIKEISEQANISRKTFYHYYNGVYELLEDIKKEFIIEVDGVFKNLDIKNDLLTPSVLFEKLSIIFYGKNLIFSKILANKSNYDLVYKFAKILATKFVDSCCTSIYVNYSERTIKIIFDFILNGFLSVFQKYFDFNDQKKIDEFIKALTLVMFSGLNGLLNLK